eukprot:CAMPEP_0194746942 /NCGR_PEP_ID=MMETSP0323_2-20130528/999_1 /TAXON_ID=2866 ORGANISM="Crypthecodinium cohnii, Strain Seligo" /NCGR_SAMPLE_ID=MMETSP0323_2 /ASSEMBLY_ACC=CAM_ASM_000346 /LENGTH=107 /DNA_ID=CAMNT_0039659863 /DNA_START=532 /DNA_END=853 /DNA_ORIENTATION=+
MFVTFVGLPCGPPITHMGTVAVCWGGTATFTGVEGVCRLQALGDEAAGKGWPTAAVFRGGLLPETSDGIADSVCVEAPSVSATSNSEAASDPQTQVDPGKSGNATND